MSNNFEEIRKRMEALSKGEKPTPLEKNTAAKTPASASWVPSPSSQTSIAKTQKDKNQSEAGAAKKQYDSDAAMSQAGLGIVSRRLREEATKARALKEASQLEKDAKYAQDLQQEEETRGVKIHLPNNLSEAADAQAAHKLAEEWDAQEREEHRRKADMKADEDLAFALQLQQEEENRVKLHTANKPSETTEIETIRKLAEELDTKERSEAREKIEREDAELAQRLQQEENDKGRPRSPDSPRKPKT